MPDQPQVSKAPVAATPATAPATADPKAAVKATVEATKTGQPTAAQAEAAKKFKVKLEGKELEVDEKTLIDNYQLRQLSDKKRSEAELMMKQYNEFFDLMKRDPIKSLNALGLDFDQLSTSYLAKKAEEAMMDPKDAELKKAKAEAELYKKWVEEQKSAKEKEQQDAAVQSERQRIHSEIIEAIEANKELGLPVDEDLVIQIAQQMMVQDKAKKPLNAAEALPHVYKKTQSWITGLATKLDGEKLVTWLGPDVAAKIRKYDLAQLKAKRAATQPSSEAKAMVKPQASTEKAKPYKTWSQFKAERLDTIK